MQDDFSMQGNENNNNRTRKILIVALAAVSLICTAILVVALISGGSNNSPDDPSNSGDTEAYSYTYAGENDEWAAEYAITGAGEWTNKDDTLGYDGSYSTILTISFKKDLKELPSVRHLIISYKLKNGGGTQDETYDEKSTVRSSYSQSSGSSGMYIYAKGDVFTVTINLDGAEQTIELYET